MNEEFDVKEWKEQGREQLDKYSREEKDLVNDLELLREKIRELSAIFGEKKQTRTNIRKALREVLVEHHNELTAEDLIHLAMKKTGADRVSVNGSLLRWAKSDAAIEIEDIGGDSDSVRLNPPEEPA